MPGAPETVAELRRRGVGVAYATNNAGKTPAAVAEKLRSLGFPADAQDVVTSSVAAAALIAPGTRCLVIGMDGLTEPLAERGAELVDDHHAADVVVVGIDLELTWHKLRAATLALRRGARFVGTNADATFPAPDGLVPGNGATLAALQTASERRPEIAGKPQTPMFEAARRRLPDGPVLVVGDRLDTDVAGGAAMDWDTSVVLTGVATSDAAARANPAPTYVLDSLTALLAPPPS